jgi:hypothetical protein
MEFAPWVTSVNFTGLRPIPRFRIYLGTRVTWLWGAWVFLLDRLVQILQDAHFVFLRDLGAMENLKQSAIVVMNKAIDKASHFVRWATSFTMAFAWVSGGTSPAGFGVQEVCSYKVFTIVRIV